MMHPSTTGHHPYQPPERPDMRADGTPDILTPRVSRARYVPIDTEDPITQAPAPLPAPRRRRPLRRLAGWLLRGTLAHWLPLGCGVLLMIGGYAGVENWLLPALGNLSDQWHLGDGRIVQLDADVGHGGTSHFLAQWYHGSILVMEMAENNPHVMHAYKLTPFTREQGTITLKAFDVNRDDKPDLIVQVAGDPAALVLYNNGTAFQQEEA